MKHKVEEKEYIDEKLKSHRLKGLNTNIEILKNNFIKPL